MGFSPKFRVHEEVKSMASAWCRPTVPYQSVQSTYIPLKRNWLKTAAVIRTACFQIPASVVSTIGTEARDDKHYYINTRGHLTGITLPPLTHAPCLRVRYLMFTASDLLPVSRITPRTTNNRQSQPRGYLATAVSSFSLPSFSLSAPNPALLGI